MKNEWKKCICLESDISNDELFPILDGTDCDWEIDVDSVLNDSDTEFVWLANQ